MVTVSAPLANRYSDLGFTAQNRVQLIRGGPDYFLAMEDIISRARHTIHLQVYIFEYDETGRRILQALEHAALRKVNVYLVLDGYASRHLDVSALRRLKQSGVQVRWFEPLFRTRSFYFGRRMHHKVLVVDGRYAVIGGINIGNRYNKVDSTPPWLDWAVTFEGEAAIEAYFRCLEMWPAREVSQMPVMPILHVNRKSSRDCLIRLRVNDWVGNRQQITRTYLEMMHRAKKEAILLCSYFIPGHHFRKHLLQALKRGVTVKLILTGRSDVALAKPAEQFLYPWLLRHGVEIYENHDTMVHGKLAVFDQQWVTIGSYNLNNVSAYASIELNADIRDREFGTSVAATLNEVIHRECRRIDPSDYYEKTFWWTTLQQRLAYELVRAIVWLFTFYFKKEKS